MWIIIQTFSLFLLMLYFASCCCLPTFGNEYVHIKVLVPKEGGPSHGAKHLPAPVPKHKVIHHYHHRARRPNKKITASNQQQKALVESLVLADLKEPITGEHLDFLNHASDIAEHLVKPVETYVVKEEPKKKQQVNTFKVVEETLHYPDHNHYSDSHSHSYPSKEPIETIKVIDTKVPHHDYHPEHIDTFKVINTKESLHDEGYHYESRKPQQHVETLKIIESKRPSYDSTHYKYKPPRRPVEDDESDYANAEAFDEGYHYEPKPYVKTVKFVESKAPSHSRYEYRPSYEQRPKSDEHRAHSEYNHHSHHHHHDEAYSPVESQGGGYNYNGPSDEAYTSIESHAGGYHYKGPSSSSSTSGYRYHKPAESYGTPFGDSKTKYENSFRSTAVHHSIDDYSPQTDLLPPNPERNQRFKETIRPNSLYDDEDFSPPVPANHRPETKYLPPTEETIAWPGNESTYSAAETYTGIDSYSAGHVQGVGSGGYNYQGAFL